MLRKYDSLKRTVYLHLEVFQTVLNFWHISPQPCLLSSTSQMLEQLILSTKNSIQVIL